MELSQGIVELIQTVLGLEEEEPLPEDEGQEDEEEVLKRKKEAWENICNDPHAYIGKIIVVKYFEETRNERGGLSLRFPIFKGFREPIDKVNADY